MHRFSFWILPALGLFLCGCNGDKNQASVPVPATQANASNGGASGNVSIAASTGTVVSSGTAVSPTLASVQGVWIGNGQGSEACGEFVDPTGRVLCNCCPPSLSAPGTCRTVDCTIVPQTNVPLTLTLSESGTAVSGNFSTRFSQGLVTGSFDGLTLQLRLTPTNQSCTQTLSATGALSGNQLTLTFGRLAVATPAGGTACANLELFAGQETLTRATSSVSSGGLF